MKWLANKSRAIVKMSARNIYIVWALKHQYEIIERQKLTRRGRISIILCADRPEHRLPFYSLLATTI